MAATSGEVRRDGGGSGRLRRRGRAAAGSGVGRRVVAAGRQRRRRVRVCVAGLVGFGGGWALGRLGATSYTAPRAESRLGMALSQFPLFLSFFKYPDVQKKK